MGVRGRESMRENGRKRERAREREEGSQRQMEKGGRNDGWTQLLSCIRFGLGETLSHRSFFPFVTASECSLHNERHYKFNMQSYSQRQAGSYSSIAAVHSQQSEEH